MSSDPAVSTSWSVASSRVLESLHDELQQAYDEIGEGLQQNHNAVLLGLSRRLARMRSALLMIRKPCIAWLAGEVQALIEAAAAGELVEHAAASEVERARVLVESIDTLDTAVAGLDESARNDTALPWLDRVNEWRSLRGKEFVTDALLLALDIDVSIDDAPHGADTPEWLQLCQQQRARLMRLLLEWFRAVNASDEARRSSALSALVPCLEQLAESAAAPEREALVFRAARTIAGALAAGALEDSGSLRRLFGLLEQRLLGSGVDGDDTLLRNLLYYVALAGRRTDLQDARLERRFDLRSVRDAIAESASWRHAAPAINRRLRDGIYHRSLELMHPVESWLEAGAHGLDKRTRESLLERLRELDAMLSLFGEEAARRQVSVILERLVAPGAGQLPEPATRLALASDLLRLRHCLESQRLQANRLRPGAGDDDSGRTAEPSSAQAESRALAQRIAQTGNPVAGERDPAITEAQTALISEARQQLRELEPALDGLLGGHAGRTLPVESVLTAVRRISLALGILPLPEGSVLLDGLADAVQLGAPGHDRRLRKAIAALVVQIDACLEDTARTQGVGDDALGNAENALAEVRSAMPGTRLFDKVVAGAQARPTRESASVAQVASREDADERALTDAALMSLDEFVAGMSADVLQSASLVKPLRTLERIGRRAGLADLSRVCGAALDRLDADPDAPPVDSLNELYTVLPQLIAGIGQDNSGHADVSVDALVAALAPRSSVQSLPSTGTGNAERRAASGNRSPVADATTLERVFVTECEGHLRVLEHELALAPVAPGSRMLRALHTIEGSAQTVGATRIVAIVQPLQSLAAERQTQGLDFGPTDIDELHDGVTRIRTELYNTPLQLPFGDDHGDDWKDHGEGQADDDPDEDGMLDTGGLALSDVFADEAQELIARLRVVEPVDNDNNQTAAHAAADDANDDANEVGRENRARALSALHTLKGSARVAGWPGLAELAHEHESSIQSATGQELAASIERARRELDAASPNTLKAVAPNQQIIATGDTRVTENAWERLLALASDLTASQARLAVELDRLTDAARELETAARRWRRLPRAAEFLDTEAARELTSDVDSVRVALDLAVRGVDTERRMGTRVARALQQDLVRARLVRFGDMLPRLQEVVTDAADAFEVQAGLHLEGKDIALDGALCRRLLPAIEQLLRNAVAHGIESPSQRTTTGKPATGSVSADARMDGLDLVLQIRDDGRGLPPGRASLDLLEEAGFSTAAAADESRQQLAGHGLGLASVRRVLTDLDGDLRIVEVDTGACFELRVPQRVPVQQVVLVQAGDMCVGIPVNHVRDVLPYDVSNTPRDLADCLASAASTTPFDPALRRTLVLTSHGQEARLGVDSVAGYQEVVVQAAGPQLAHLGRYSGAAALGDGRIALLLSPLAWQAPERAPPPVTMPVGRRHVLVVDDSPTQRAWLQQQLGEMQMDVTEARDGQQALEILDTRTFDAILLDIDMPRIDGYGVLDALRPAPGADLPIPVLMLTSRSSSRDRTAVRALGARELLAKPASAEELRDALAAVLEEPVKQA